MLLVGVSIEVYGILSINHCCSKAQFDVYGNNKSKIC